MFDETLFDDRVFDLSDLPDVMYPGFAVMCEFPLFCPSTDACYGSAKVVIKRFDTQGEAQEYADKNTDPMDDCNYWVELRPYREGEDKAPRARNLLEERNHAWAVEQDQRELQERAWRFPFTTFEDDHHV